MCMPFQDEGRTRQKKKNDKLINQKKIEIEKKKKNENEL